MTLNIGYPDETSDDNESEELLSWVAATTTLTII